MRPLLARLRSLKPSMDEVTEALSYLGQDTCVFSEKQKQEIGGVAQATMVDPSTIWTRSTVKTQQHLHLHHYLPQRLWACLESEDKKENTFRQLAQFMCQSLGLRSPDAKTKRLAVVVVHLASDESPTPKVAYDDVHLFSDIIDQKRCSVCTTQTMSTFPDDPKVFMDAYPSALGSDDPPIECQVSLSAIIERCRKDVTPCRNTNKQVREHATEFASSPPARATSSDSTNGVLLAILEKHMSQKGHAPLGDELASLGASPLLGVPKSPRSSLVACANPSSGVYSRSPAPLFSGGITPSCLDPCHDKLAQLKDKLGCANVGDDLPPLSSFMSGDGDAIIPTGKSGKRDREEAGLIDSETAEEEEALLKGKSRKGTLGALPMPKKRPACASGKSRKSSAAPKAASSKGVAAAREALLKKSPKVARPPQSQKPTAHAGGKIYFSKPKGVYRVYLRVGDRIEKCVAASEESPADMRRKFQVCCALIENDKRPVRAE